ncbi:hypothetical protein CONLIGDRAFT_658777 [Coniochaeta ligniaria NRRL 30616]|uniref:Uncharacterized protein n=1 Tax=Coniochaeta ligniaria NRRL 30616 TaxID=1408157 RepID=A0A1J7K4N3_9PEZI|nr:hypothetical protein CONLIGDRAFT_658777 [Coniochaeta ligniaria NRRL 30616]
MPPTLDLSRTRHSKMIVSPPRINLRRAASYNHDRGPLSSTSSRFNFNHLLFSPPPSPGLPALVKRTRKPSGNFSSFVRPSRVMRILGWTVFVSSFFFFIRLVVGGPHGIPVFPWSSHPQDDYEMVAGDDLPDFPTPVVVTDKRGTTKWTVSIPPSHDFPLSTAQYSDICAKCREVSSRVQALHSNGRGLPQTILALGSHSESQDRQFIDVREAEKAGLLGVGESKGSLLEKPVCQQSMTFVLETDDAGLGKTMVLLWIAYGIAQNEGRSFFIDDSRWAYGDYTAIFQPPPVQACRPPPRNQMIPCPRQARHLIVSSATAAEILGDLGDLAISETTPEASTQKTIFSLARQGHDALFKLNREDGNYVESRSRALLARRITPRSKGTQNGMAIGIHVRRGDRHPLEYQYRDSYIPTNTYAERARELLENSYNHTGPHGGEDIAAKQHSFVVLASDDPTVYEADEFRSGAASGTSGVMRAQERIKLASKAAIQQAQPDKHVMRKFVDETFGWEGGFFAPMFKNLGVGGGGAANAEKTGGSAGASAESLRLRSLVGRAYVMDLAVLADVSDVVVCTVSATGCRLLAVMMGWDSAMEAGNWVNVDGHYRWTGIEL